MDRLHCMQVFVRVVEHGSFTRAALALGISRASATEAVAQLERRLGARLLNRTTRRVTITDEGQSWYAGCLRILDLVAEAEDSVSGTRLCPRGRLRISVPQSFVNAVFFPALTRFLDSYPALDVEVILTDRAVNLVEKGVDCAIRGLEITPEAVLVARHLSPANWLTCASPAYLDVHGRPAAVHELQQHNCIRFVSQSTARALDWSFRVEGKTRTIVPRGNLRLTSFDATIRTALTGAGIVQIPDALGVDAVVAGELEPILADIVAPAPPLTLVYPGNRYLTAKVRAFADSMMAAFPKKGWWGEVMATRCHGGDGPADTDRPAA